MIISPVDLAHAMHGLPDSCTGRAVVRGSGYRGVACAHPMHIATMPRPSEAPKPPERQPALIGLAASLPGPSSRAAASAAVAEPSSSSELAPSVGKRARPTDTLIRRPSCSARAATPSRIRWATVRPAAPGAIRTNSSPP